MPKSVKLSKKDTKEQLKWIAKREPKQTEKEIFTDTDSEGFNQTPLEQQNYPGTQKHSGMPSRNKIKNK